MEYPTAMRDAFLRKAIMAGAKQIEEFACHPSLLPSLREPFPTEGSARKRLPLSIDQQSAMCCGNSERLALWPRTYIFKRAGILEQHTVAAEQLNIESVSVPVATRTSALWPDIDDQLLRHRLRGTHATKTRGRQRC